MRIHFRFFAVMVLAACCHAQNPHSVAVPSIMLSGSDLYMKVRLDSPLKVAKLKPGDQISGKLLQDVYSGAIEIFPAASAVYLAVDRLDQRRRVPNDHWPWVIKAFTPRHERYPVFRLVSVSSGNGRDHSLQVSLISVGKEVEVQPKTKDAKPSSDAQKSRRNLGPVITLLASARSGNLNTDATFEPSAVTIPPGTEAKVILLRDVSASKNRAGDSFQARLVEPVRVGSKVIIPEGSVLDGKVLKSLAPRTLSRSGSLHLTFTNLTIPGEPTTPIAASVAGADINQSSHTVIDQEGQMHGDRPGTAWMLLNIGVSAGISKEADDGAQLLAEALVSTATNASTAGMAKIVSTCASGIFLLTRHGRDVVLPKYTQMKITFDRDVTVPGLTTVAESQIP